MLEVKKRDTEEEKILKTIWYEEDVIITTLHILIFIQLFLLFSITELEQYLQIKQYLFSNLKV